MLKQYNNFEVGYIKYQDSQVIGSIIMFIIILYTNVSMRTSVSCLLWSIVYVLKWWWQDVAIFYLALQSGVPIHHDAFTISHT